MKYGLIGKLFVPEDSKRGQLHTAIVNKIASKADRWVQWIGEPAVTHFEIDTADTPKSLFAHAFFVTQASRDDVMNSAIAWLNANSSSVGSGSYLKKFNGTHDESTPTKCVMTVVWSK